MNLKCLYIVQQSPGMDFYLVSTHLQGGGINFQHPDLHIKNSPLMSEGFFFLHPKRKVGKYHVPNSMIFGKLPNTLSAETKSVMFT